MDATKPESETPDQLVRAKIENLRPKLLDLSRRNPLLATRLGPRSNSHLRAVDELPDVLFFKLNNGEEMELVSLPEIDVDPKDEQNQVFRDAVINARLTDEVYETSLEAIDRDADDYLERTRQIERELKDRVREQLGWAPRVQKADLNLIQHAKNNGVLPSYDLPEPPKKHREDGRHTDDLIQTLLLPADLERKLNAIVSKSRTWIQETGTNVLQVAFGFLEWSDETRSESSFAPLILLQAEIKRTRSPKGARYFIAATGDEPELNAVLGEKLRVDFTIQLPEFEGHSVEDYFTKVSKVLPEKRNWRVRRQVAIGVFPSARMAMYHDLDPNQSSFPRSEIVQSLLAGSDTAGASPFAEEYEIDKPDIEKKVPCLVRDADSSQFSVLVDIADGKNVAVEGPPGTGKSQTIVNAIAAALDAGKTVLFVAEKLAALNVVKARLESVGLGDFLLPLQAEKSTREQVMDSIRARVDMKEGRKVRGYEDAIDEFRRARARLSEYVQLISSEFGKSGLTVHSILGKSIASNSQLSGIPNAVLDRCKISEEMLTVSGIATMMSAGVNVENAHRETLVVSPHWKSTELINPDRFTVEDACALAALAAEKLSEVTRKRELLSDLAIDTHAYDSLSELNNHLALSEQHLAFHPQGLLVAVLEREIVDALAVFLERCSEIQSLERALLSKLSSPPDGTILGKVQRLAAISLNASVSVVDPETLSEELEKKRRSLLTTRTIMDVLQPLVSACPAASEWSLDHLAKAFSIYNQAGRGVLGVRNSSLNGENAVFDLRALCDEGIELKKRRDELSERVQLPIEVSTHALTETLIALRTSGPLSLLSRSYWKARGQVKSISLSGEYSKNVAVKNLEDVIAFQRQLADYLTRAEATGLFGIHYRGLETRFDVFGRLVKYFEEVYTHFGSPALGSLRDFLRTASVSQLDLLPSIKPTGITVTFRWLEARMEALSSEIEQLTGVISELRAIGRVFVTTEMRSPEIQVVRSQLEEFLSGEEELNGQEKLKEVLGSAFAGFRTETLRHGEIVQWGISAQSQANALQNIFAKGSLAKARQAIAEVLAAEDQLRLALSRLRDVAKIDTDAFLSDRTSLEAVGVLNAAAEDHSGLFAHSSLRAAVQDLDPYGFGPLLQERLLTSGRLEGLGQQIEALAVRLLAKSVYAQFGNKLSRYRGSKLDELRTTLANKDKEIMELAQRQLRTKVRASARPPAGNGSGRKSTWTEMALIENEISKKQKYISVRDLTQRAGRALLQLKPCWMMSPLAVAQVCSQR